VIFTAREKKIKEAAALKYTPGEDTAPKIIAIAKGDEAEKVIEKAKEAMFLFMKMPSLHIHSEV
jgi:type III secretion system FlhB-like substrate exporter